MDEKLKKKPSRLVFIIPAAVLLLITAAMVYIYFTQETTSKPDPASENLIRIIVGQQLNKAPDSLIDEDFAQITDLFILKLALSDIRLLEKFTNLKWLKLADIQYPKKNIPKWMSLLAKLGVFNIEERFTIDLSPLANLKNLELLYMSNSNVSDLRPLANLTNLNWLAMSNTQVSDITPLANLKSLNTLNISGTKVSDISALLNLTNLQTIRVDVWRVGNEQIAELKKALPNLLINPY